MLAKSNNLRRRYSDPRIQYNLATSNIPQCTSVLNFGTTGQSVADIFIMWRIFTGSFIPGAGGGDIPKLSSQSWVDRGVVKRSSRRLFIVAPEAQVQRHVRC